MNLMTINNLTKQYDGFVILDKINFTLNTNEKTAIVGRNGAGKSTLAKIICGEEPYDQGDIFISNQVRVGYFSQNSLLDSTDTVYNEMTSVFSKQIQMQKQITEMAKQMEGDYDEKLLEQYNHLLHEFELIDGYTFEHQIETMLNKFGFKPYYDHPINHLSGGQRTRLALAKLLLEEPDVLILDEPTNHLDIETVEFLEDFLKTYKNGVIIISHDRFFLNQIVNHVYEIEFNKGYAYKGNYDKYLELKQQRYEQLLKQYDKEQKLLEKEIDFINKNLVRASTTKRAQSRRKKIEKMTFMDNPRMDNKNIKLHFDFSQSSGNIVLTVNDLAIGYDEPLMNQINFLIEKQEKVAIIGPNGAGKSTLLKTINQMIKPLKGEIRYGANVDIAYFDQDLALLDSNKTVLDELWDEHRTMLEKDVRKILGQFLFTGEDVFKSVNELSGGEKVRLALSKLMLQKANFLILDEVTNHLDILSKEVLEEALNDYPGTILFVSHDRYFINEVATKIIEIDFNQVTQYIGDYGYYLFKRKELQNKTIEVKETNASQDYEQMKKKRSEIKKLQTKADQLEQEILSIEEKVEVLKASQLTEEVYLDALKAKEVQLEIDELEDNLHQHMEEWSELLEQLEG